MTLYVYVDCYYCNVNYTTENIFWRWNYEYRIWK